ncbi:MAG TPA: ASKHA domain-containing protein, partial [Acidobacteriaceae bacterium]|nr:ASKHA domain-containing protein [Acidobacteriaceae bacterium]
MSSNTVRIRLEPLAIELEAASGTALLNILAERGFEFPCGGEGICGGCAVRVLSGSLAVTDVDREVLTAGEIQEGWRLACQSRADSSLVLECSQWRMDVLTDDSAIPGTGKPGLGVAVDVGTTTLAAQLIELASGSVLGVETDLNPQSAWGADVMSRIRAALSGTDLTTPIRAAVGRMIGRLAIGREQEITEVILVGNTVMHHLFSGLDVEPLAHAPFRPPHLEEQCFRPEQLGWKLPSSSRIRFARCLGGFVGSDILAGIVAVGIARSEALIGLIDLGTNGEIVIGNRERIVCASTAAGPAFEAGCIRMGMRAVAGAIAHVACVNGNMHAQVIGDVAPSGICGSGIVDAVAAALETGAVLPSGRIVQGAKAVTIAPPVVLYQSDIRELQLAKGAIACGFTLLLKKLGASMADVRALHLAGAFGNYVQIRSAHAIGLIDVPESLVHAAGNT